MSILPFAAAILLVTVLLRFPPERYGFYPLCPIRRSPGWWCPGCGATRALAALLRGRMQDAIKLNGLAVMLLPGIALYAGMGYERRLKRKIPVWPTIPRAVVIGLMLAAGGFTLMRNLL